MKGLLSRYRKGAFASKQTREKQRRHKRRCLQVETLESRVVFAMTSPGYTPMRGPNIEFEFKSVAYSPTTDADRAAVVKFFLKNPNRVEGDVSIRLYWASGPDLRSGFVQSATQRILTVSKPNWFGDKTVTFSRSQLGTRPPQAKNLIAVVNDDGAVPEANRSNNSGLYRVQQYLFVNFEGGYISAPQLKSWAGSDWSTKKLDPENNGIKVRKFLSTAKPEKRNQMIQDVIAQLQKDLKPYGIEVRRTHGSPVTGQGFTTLFFGKNDIRNEKGLYGGNAANETDLNNVNATDVAFIHESENRGNDRESLLLLSDAALHEAGHTYGLFHVNSRVNGVLYNETMGLRYSTSNPSEQARDTAFLDRTFDSLDGIGSQNSHQTMLRNFGFVSNTRIRRMGGDLPGDGAQPQNSLIAPLLGSDKTNRAAEIVSSNVSNQSVLPVKTEQPAILPLPIFDGSLDRVFASYSENATKPDEDTSRDALLLDDWITDILPVS